MTSPRHKHTPVTDANGRNICSSCQMVVWNPIKSSDDPRLAEAGLMRSQHHDVYDDIAYPPLPELLIALYHNGSAIGLVNAPVAWYVDNVCRLEGDRSQGVLDPDTMWTDFHRVWHTRWIESARQQS